MNARQHSILILATTTIMGSVFAIVTTKTCGNKDEPKNFNWVIPHKLGGTSMPKTSKNVKFLCKQGITQVVSLTPEFRPDFSCCGMTVHYVPVKDFTAPTIEQLKNTSQIIMSALKRKEKVVVHCKGGSGRTGTVLAAYFILSGMNSCEAIKWVRTMRPGSVEILEQELALHTFYNEINHVYKKE